MPLSTGWKGYIEKKTCPEVNLSNHGDGDTTLDIVLTLNEGQMKLISFRLSRSKETTGRSEAFGVVAQTRAGRGG